MSRQQRYSGMPWDIPWQHDPVVRHQWWLIAVLILAALLLIGVRATGGIGLRTLSGVAGIPS